ncbi:uroporphyrinogen-III synthase [Chlamydia sp.]|uniref:uroporphyrinogen-III synthase n=1 Tax=Chlamydia sp. TaxID=35827 RepID=UPI0025C3DC70|nr:uroporphyrinogen-III synthase [Chlamydia sp.]MBQ8498668.1 uroporphyrinogen-III synthase [Chlamydia sp.]
MPLYLGLNPLSAKRFSATFQPIIRIIPFSKQAPQIRRARKFLVSASYILLTSPSSTDCFFSSIRKKILLPSLINKNFVTIGETTSSRLRVYLPKAKITQCEFPQAEAFLPILSSLPKNSSLLYPHSSLSRPVIRSFLETLPQPFFAYPHYTVKAVKLSLKIFIPHKTIILTSPSIVRAYAELFPLLPNKEHWCLGEVSASEFKKIFHCSPSKILFSAKKFSYCESQ